jgi:hypothetical protein
MNQIARASCLRQARFATLPVPLSRRYFASSIPVRASQSNQPSKSSCQNQKPAAPASSLSTFSRAFWACRSTWRRAGINTLRCLIGCTVGDFSALWTLQSYYPELGMNTIMLVSSASWYPLLSQQKIMLTFRFSGFWHHNIHHPRDSPTPPWR